jgi:endothelin-converting enzyme/putative endopeptidase
MRFSPRSAFRSIAAACTLLFILSSFAIAQPASGAALVTGPAVNPAYMDRSVRPGEDFFSYACGTWEKTTVIPPDRAAVSPGTPLYDAHDKKLADLIDEISRGGTQAGGGARKVSDLYKSFIDEAAIEARGTKPLEAPLKTIAAIRDKKDLAWALGETLRADEDALNNTNFHSPNLFGLWVAPGFEDSTHYTAYLLQGGLDLPDREYYLSDADAMKEIREKYKAHIVTLMKLAGFDNADARAERVIALEHAIAEKHWSLADDNDVHKANNPWKASDFAVKAPGLDWTEYFRAAGLGKQASFMVWQPSAFAGESALVASEPLESWKDWLAFHLIDYYAPVLPKAFADEEFAFYGKTLNGATEQLPRWRRGVFFVNGLLGDEFGQIYAKRYFPPEVKAQVQAMVANLLAVYRKRIQGLTWMTPSTKAEALAKLDTLYVGVGYGESWHTYSNYEVKADDAFGNLGRGDLSEYQRQVARLGGTVDKKEWSMTPQTINAVNLPLQNALNFPAAILQPPSYDAKAPAAANYGAMGAVIGHEISHTFDSEGSAFDSQGRLRNWWTPDDFAHFEAETAKLVAQYDAYKPFPDLSLNGKQTLAENLADVAGLAAAYDAYKASLRGETAPVQDGFSGDQQFFIAFSQSWADKLRDAALRQQVLTDTHSPGRYRAIAVRNLDGWYAAFDVKPGEKLYLDPAQRVQIW